MKLLFFSSSAIVVVLIFLQNVNFTISKGHRNSKDKKPSKPYLFCGDKFKKCLEKLTREPYIRTAGICEHIVYRKYLCTKDQIYRNSTASERKILGSNRSIHQDYDLYQISDESNFTNLDYLDY